MNFIELIHLIEELIRSEAKVIAFFFVGIAVAMIGVYSVRRWVFPRTDSEKEIGARDTEIARKGEEIALKAAEIGRLDRKLEDRDRAIDELQKQKQQLSKTCEDLTDQNLELSDKADTAQQRTEQVTKDADLYRRKAVTVVTSYKKQVFSLTEQIKKIELMEGRFWESPVRTKIPAFRPLNDKNVIIAVANLKGGVGKTSLTANLAATYWSMGKRVLVVDLDYQASLTFLCLAPEQVLDAGLGDGRFVQNVLKAKANHAALAWSNLTRINEQGAYLLAASERLTEVEEHIKAQWLLQPNDGDLRYVLRSALHDPMIQERFDVVLLDCPPRMTPASINALACADFALIPALLDRTSTEAVPRLLQLLRNLITQGVCPNLSVLGVIGNRAHARTKLSVREKNVWSELRDKCKDVWGDAVHHFDRFVPTSSQFAEAAAKREFAAFHPNLQKIFVSLVNEIEKRKAAHERSRVATVS